MDGNKKTIFIIIFIAALALFLRVANFQEMKAHNPLFSTPVVDAKEYVDDADFYINKGWLGPSGSYFHPPAYSYFVAIIFKIFGRSLDRIKLFQIFLDIVNLLLVYFIAKKAFDKRVALISIVLYAVYIPIIQFTVEILPPIFMIFLSLLAILLLFSVKQRIEKLRYIFLAASGLILGILIITLPNFLLCVPFVLFWIHGYFKKASFRIRLRYVALFLIASLIPLCLVFARNLIFARENVLISHHGGINFYIGNNPDINRTVSIRPGIEWEGLLMYPYGEVKITNFGDQSQFWYRNASRFIISHPFKWVWLEIKKSVLFFNSFEFPRNFDNAFFAQYSFVTRLPFAKLNFVMPLALSIVGISFFNRTLCRSSEAKLILTIIFCYAFSIIIFFIAGRYRMPIIPLLIILCAYYISLLSGKIALGNYHATSMLVGLAVILAVFTNARFFYDSYPYRVNMADTYALIGNYLLSDKKVEEAGRYFKEGLLKPEDPSSYELYYYAAFYYVGNGDIDKAIEYYKKSAELNPGNYRAFNSLGFHYKMKREYDKAIDYLNRARELAKCYPDIYLNLADCYMVGKHDRDAAIKALQSYRTYCPSPSPVISYTLGILYMDLFQNWEEAAKNLEEAIRYPQGIETSPETYNRLGACYYYLNKRDKAEDAWIKGLKIDSNNKAIKINLLLMQK